MSTTSYSEVSSYLLCRRKHFYGYSLGLERNQSSESLAAGKALHSVMETYYGHLLSLGDTLAEQQAGHFDAVNMAMQCWDNVRPDPDDEKKRQDLGESLHLYFQDEPFVMKGYRVLGVEREFTLAYDDEDGQYPFVIDLLLEDPWGEVAVVDHKTGYEFLADGNAEFLQPQLPLYIAGLRALRYPAAYGIYNQFRTRKIKAPTREQLLRVAGPIRPTDERVRRTFIEQIELAGEIAERKALTTVEQDYTAFRTANKMVCQSCAFVELCISDLQGHDSALVIETQYHKRQRRSFAVVSEEYA